MRLTKSVETPQQNDNQILNPNLNLGLGIHEKNYSPSIKNEPRCSNDDDNLSNASSSVHEQICVKEEIENNNESSLSPHQNHLPHFEMPDVGHVSPIIKSPIKDRCESISEVEPEEIENVLQKAKELTLIKPISSLSESDDNNKLEPPVTKLTAIPNSPQLMKGGQKHRRRRRTIEKQTPQSSDSLSDDDGFSSANAQSRRSRSKSIDQDKKARGRPRKTPIAPPTSSLLSPIQTIYHTSEAESVTSNKDSKRRMSISSTNTTVSVSTTPSKKDVPAAVAQPPKKSINRRRESRAKSTVKSREILETTSDSSDNETGGRENNVNEMSNDGKKKKSSTKSSKSKTKSSKKVVERIINQTSPTKPAPIKPPFDKLSDLNTSDSDE